MNRDEITELAAVYALGALDGDDRVRFEALLTAGHPDAVRALRDFEESLIQIAGDLREPAPPALKQRLMAGLGEEARRVPPPVERRALPPPRRRSFWGVAVAGAIAAGLAAIVVGVWVSRVYEQRLEALAREAQTVRADLEKQQAALASQQAVIAMLKDPATQVVPLGGLEASPESRGRMLWHGGSGGLFVAAGLPPAPEGKIYQLWAIAGQNPPVSAGVFAPDPNGVANLDVPPLPGLDRVDAFAVTLEPAGGVPAPTGPMFLLGKA
ncbi:MAG: anti-sigma factor [Candidatus Rokubacteria bacterium]|nr:anti-sigma factor [Candidatus Rokubacteria bacterium]